MHEDARGFFGALSNSTEQFNTLDATQLNQDGTFKAQADSFKSLLDNMASRPQDYITDHGRLTTNAVEGFHGLALLYRADLVHKHYVCKTYMAICH